MAKFALMFRCHLRANFALQIIVWAPTGRISPFTIFCVSEKNANIIHQVLSGNSGSMLQASSFTKTTKQTLCNGWKRRWNRLLFAAVDHQVSCRRCVPPLALQAARHCNEVRRRNPHEDSVRCHAERSCWRMGWKRWWQGGDKAQSCFHQGHQWHVIVLSGHVPDVVCGWSMRLLYETSGDFCKQVCTWTMLGTSTAPRVPRMIRERCLDVRGVVKWWRVIMDSFSHREQNVHCLHFTSLSYFLWRLSPASICMATLAPISFISSGEIRPIQTDSRLHSFRVAEIA